MIAQMHYVNGEVRYTRNGVLLAKIWNRADGKRYSYGLDYITECITNGEKLVVQYVIDFQSGGPICEKLEARFGKH